MIANRPVVSQETRRLAHSAGAGGAIPSSGKAASKPNPREDRSFRRFGTYACAAVLGPLTAAAATVGGVFGPIAVWIYASVLSLPSWLVLWLLEWRRAAPHPDR